MGPEFDHCDPAMRWADVMGYKSQVCIDEFGRVLGLGDGPDLRTLPDEFPGDLPLYPRGVESPRSV